MAARTARGRRSPAPARLSFRQGHGIKARVIALRDEYQKIFIGLIDDLPLRKGVDRRNLRLTLIGALSWSLIWFKKERDTPAAITKQILSMFRAGPNRSWVAKTSELAKVDATTCQSAKTYSIAITQDACPENLPEVAS
jgi:hypothetical protein